MIQSKATGSSAAQLGQGARPLTAPASVPRPTPHPSRASVAPKNGSTAPLSLVRAASSSPPSAVRAMAKTSPAPSASQPAPSASRPTRAEATRSARRSLPPPPAPRARAARTAPSATAHRSTPPPLPVNELTLLTEYDLIDDEVEVSAAPRAAQPVTLEKAAVRPPIRNPQPTNDEAQIAGFSRTEPPPRPRSARRGALIGTLVALSLAAATVVFCSGAPSTSGRGTAQAGALPAATLSNGNAGLSPRGAPVTLAKTEVTNGTVRPAAGPVATPSKASHSKATPGKHGKTGAGKAKPHPKPHQQALADDSLKL